MNKPFIKPNAEVFVLHPESEEMPVLACTVETLHSDGSVDVWNDYLGSICTDVENVFATAEEAERASHRNDESTTERPEWKPWFHHGDGTPRSLYMALDGKTELVLTDAYPDRCSLTVKLDNGSIRQEKSIEYNRTGRAADEKVQEWATRAAVNYLNELADLAAKTASLLG